MEEQINELMELLSESELEHFNSLAPSYKKIFVNHAFKSKVEKTRLKNIDEVKEAMELKCKNIFEYKKKINPVKLEKTEDMTDDQKIMLYFDKIENDDDRVKVTNLYNELLKINENLAPIYAWNNPMIKYNEAFNCGISIAKSHFTVAFDVEALEFFKERISENGYKLNAKTFTIKYNQDIDFNLLKDMVLFSIELRKDAKGFWS